VAQGTHVPPGYASFVLRERSLRLMAWMQQPSRIGSQPIRIVVGGGAAALMTKVVRQHNVASLPELIASAQAAGARLVGCTMTWTSWVSLRET
jgi:peroxiredoxin family protein